MYCKHCYRMMEDGADICPACGKSQTEKVKKPIGKGLRILLGIAAWFGSMIVVGMIGTALKLPSSLYSVIVLVVPVLVAFKVAAPKKMKFKAPQKPIPVKPIPMPDPAPKSADSEQDRQVQAIVQSLHDGTFKETMQELFGESYTDNDDKAIVSESDTPSSIAKTYNVTGIQHYMDNVLSLSYDNPDYEMSKREIIDSGMTDEKIWEYGFYGKNVEVIPEPDNPYDPRAIKVIIDGKHVGYIKSGACPRLLKVINEKRIRRILCSIGGGRYKEVYEDEENDTYEVEHGETNYSIKLTVYESVK